MPWRNTLTDNTTSNDKLEVVKLPSSIEAAVDLILQLLGLFLIYWLFVQIGEQLIGDEFTPDILLSLVVLPSIYILKDSISIIEPFFVKVILDSETISVKQGVLTTYEDSLNLKNVENIEIVTTLLGRCLDYATLRVYAYGSWVQIPSIKNAANLKTRIEKITNAFA